MAPWRGIVKVQRNLAGNAFAPRTRVLIHNQDKSVRFEGPIADPLIAWFGDEDKFFAMAEMRGSLIHLVQRVEWEDW